MVNLDPTSTPQSTLTPALIINESSGGCALLLVTNTFINPGMRIRAQVGKLNPMDAEIRWVISLDNQIKKLGLQYIS